VRPSVRAGAAASIAAYSMFMIVLFLGIYGAYRRRLFYFKLVRRSARSAGGVQGDGGGGG